MKYGVFEILREGGGSERDVPYVCGHAVTLVPAPVGPHLKRRAQLRASLQDTEIAEHVQRRAAELVEGHRSDEEQLSELRGLCLEKKVVQGALIALCNSLTRGWKQMRVGLRDLKGLFQTKGFLSHASP